MPGPVTAIRPATAEDRDAIGRICIATGLDGADASGHYVTPELLPQIWAYPYLAFPGAFALVAEVDGTVAGYVLGAPDTRAFERWCARQWWPALRERYPVAAASASDRPLAQRIASPPREEDELLDRYPAHLHVDLLPVAQGTGLGRRLIGRFLELARLAGAPGVHVGVSAANTAALGFYRHLGFEELAHGPGHVTLGCRL